MKALIIYDQTGRIWSIIYGEESAPQGLLSLFADIPEGAVMERIDVTDSANPKPVYRFLPDSDIGRLQKQAKDLESGQETIRKQMAALAGSNNDLTLALADMIGGAEDAQ